jgi:nicotinamide mononucleotide transporter
MHGIYLGAGTAASLLFGYFFDVYTPAAATYWDAFTTVFAVLATVMLAKRQLDNWVYWVVVDAIYVGLYYSRGAYLLALVMAVYTAMAVHGYWHWRREWEKNVKLV